VRQACVTKVDEVLPKPMKTTCGPCVDTTQVVLPWYAVAGTGIAEGVDVAADALCTKQQSRRACNLVEMPVPRIATLLGLLMACACESRTSSAVMLPIAWLSA
jgi:hypothetical protein